MGPLRLLRKNPKRREAVWKNKNRYECLQVGGRPQSLPGSRRLDSKMYEEVSLFHRGGLLSVQAVFLFSDWRSLISTSGTHSKIARYSLGTQIINCNICIFHFITTVSGEVFWSLLTLVVSMTTGSRKSSPTFTCSQTTWGRCSRTDSSQLHRCGVGTRVCPWTSSSDCWCLHLDSSSPMCLRIKLEQTHNTCHSTWS